MLRPALMRSARAIPIRRVATDVWRKAEVRGMVVQPTCQLPGKLVRAGVNDVPLEASPKWCPVALEGVQGRDVVSSQIRFREVALLLVAAGSLVALVLMAVAI
jgi:hypothetical protein